MTIFEQEIFNEIAQDYIQQFKNAIETKPVKRKAVRKGKNGSVEYIKFEAVVNASGNLANSPRIELTETELNIYVAGYIDELIYGKAPSPLDVSALEIETWMRSKGIDPEFVSVDKIMNNIEEFGTSIFREFQGQDSGLLDDINIEGSIEKAKQNLILKKIKEITNGINSN
jgi:hypothetical protein